MHWHVFQVAFNDFCSLAIQPGQKRCQYRLGIMQYSHLGVIDSEKINEARYNALFSPPTYLSKRVLPVPRDQYQTPLHEQ